jgi:hypothetical protein
MEGRRHSNMNGASSVGQPSLIPLNLNNNLGSLVVECPSFPDHESRVSTSSGISSTRAPATPAESASTPLHSSFTLAYSAISSNLTYSGSPAISTLDGLKDQFDLPSMDLGAPSATGISAEIARTPDVVDKPTIYSTGTASSDRYASSDTKLASSRTGSLEREVWPRNQNTPPPQRTSDTPKKTISRSSQNDILARSPSTVVDTSWDVVGMKQLLAWAGGLARRPCISHSDLMDGHVIMSAMHMIFPKAFGPPSNHIMSASERWKAIMECAETVSLPTELLDWTGIAEGRYDAAYVVLATLFFLHGLLGTTSFSVDLELPIEPELARFLRSKRSLESLRECMHAYVPDVFFFFGLFFFFVRGFDKEVGVVCACV